MPVITLQSPWEAAAGFATDYVAARNDADDKRKTLALEAAKQRAAAEQTQYDRGRDATADAAAANKATADGVAAAAKAKHDDVELQIEQEKLAVAKALLPGQIAAQKAAADLAAGKISQQQAALIKTKAEGDLATTKAKLEKQYGPAKAQEIIASAQATIAAKHASATASYASAGHSEAETAGVDRKLATGGFDYHPKAAKADAAGAVAQLSPKARQLYDLMYSTNNPPTAQEAVLAIRNPRNGLTDADRAALQQLVTAKSAALQTPAEEAGAARTAATGARQGVTDATKENDRQFATISKSKGFKALPVPDQELMQSGVDAHGYAPSIQILQGIASGATPSSTVTPEQATRILHALGG